MPYSSVLRIGRASVAIRRFVRSYIRKGLACDSEGVRKGTSDLFALLLVEAQREDGGERAMMLRSGLKDPFRCLCN